MRKNKLFLFLIVFVPTAALFAFASLNISGSTPVTDHQSYSDKAGPGIHLGFGWREPLEMPMCLAVVDTVSSKGFPFAYEREPQPCGGYETNDAARLLNIMVALLAALALSGFLSAKLYKIKG